MQQKIQCLNCGASSDFIEKKPGFYLCGYCGSTFEHVSIVPNINLDNQLFNQLEQVYQELLGLTTSKPKYHERILTGFLQMSSCLQTMTDLRTQQKAFHLFEELLQREETIYKNYNIDFSEVGIDTVTHKIENILVKAIYLKQVYGLWAHHLSKLAVTEEELNTALHRVQQAQEIKLSVDLPIVDLRRIRFGLLRRLDRNEEAFNYLDTLLQTTEDREQLRYDFEDVFESSAYLAYKEHKG